MSNATHVLLIFAASAGVAAACLTLATCAGGCLRRYRGRISAAYASGFADAMMLSHDAVDAFRQAYGPDYFAIFDGMRKELDKVEESRSLFPPWGLSVSRETVKTRGEQEVEAVMQMTGLGRKQAAHLIGNIRLEEEIEAREHLPKLSGDWFRRGPTARSDNPALTPDG